VEDRVANLVSLLQARKSRLIEAARQTREARVRSLRDQVARCATHLQTTTALLTFCIEALKETDSAAFLQIGGMLSVRAATAAGSWGGAEGVQEIARLPLLDLTLDDKPLRRAIDQLTFVQLKRESIANVSIRFTRAVLARGLNLRSSVVHLTDLSYLSSFGGGFFPSSLRILTCSPSLRNELGNANFFSPQSIPLHAAFAFAFDEEPEAVMLFSQSRGIVKRWWIQARAFMRPYTEFFLKFVATDCGVSGLVSRGVFKAADLIDRFRNPDRRSRARVPESQRRSA